MRQLGMTGSPWVDCQIVGKKEFGIGESNPGLLGDLQ